MDELGCDRGVVEGVHLEGGCAARRAASKVMSRPTPTLYARRWGRAAGRISKRSTSTRGARDRRRAGAARARVERVRVVVHVVQRAVRSRVPVVARAEQPAADAEIVVVVVVPRRRRVERHVASIVREIVTLDVLSSAASVMVRAWRRSRGPTPRGVPRRAPRSRSLASSRDLTSIPPRARRASARDVLSTEKTAPKPRSGVDAPRPDADSEAAAGDHEEDERGEGAHVNVEREREPNVTARGRVCAREPPRGSDPIERSCRAFRTTNRFSRS